MFFDIRVCLGAGVGAAAGVGGVLLEATLSLTIGSRRLAAMRAAMTCCGNACCVRVCLCLGTAPIGDAAGHTFGARLTLSLMCCLLGSLDSRCHGIRRSWTCPQREVRSDEGAGPAHDECHAMKFAWQETITLRLVGADNATVGQNGYIVCTTL